MPGLENKPVLDQGDLLRKRPGRYVSALPLVNLSSDTGFGYGVGGYYYDTGAPSDPLWRYTQYRHRIYAQYFTTTFGLDRHKLTWDAPYLGGSLYRVQGKAMYERNIATPYYGVGEAGLGLTRGGVTYADTAALEAANRTVENGVAFTKYNLIDLFRPYAELTVERDLLGGVLRPLLGYRFTKVTVRDYTGSTVNGETASGAEVRAFQGPTRLYEDCADGRILGCNGGNDSFLKIGLAYDTRDYAPNPNDGIFADAVAELSYPWLGSDFAYTRYTVTPRGYFRLWNGGTEAVLAGRAVYTWTDGDAPFFAYSRMGYTEGDEDGLGGFRGLRGFKLARFQGPVAAMANLELRWTFLDLKVWTEDFTLMLVPFVDSGRVWDRVADTSFRDWRTSPGAGLRFTWNTATVLFIDYSVSAEGSGLHMDFAHSF